MRERPIVRLARPRVRADGGAPLIRRHATVATMGRRSRPLDEHVPMGETGAESSTEAASVKLPALVKAPAIASNSRLLSATRARTGGITAGASASVSDAQIYASLNGHKRISAVRRITHAPSLPEGISVVATRAMHQSISMPALTDGSEYRTAAPRSGMPLEQGTFKLKQRVIVPSRTRFRRRRMQAPRPDEAAWVTSSTGMPRVIV